MNALRLDDLLHVAARAEYVTLAEAQVSNLSILHPLDKQERVKRVRACCAMALSQTAGRTMHYWLKQLYVSRPGPLLAWVRNQGLDVIQSSPGYVAALAYCEANLVQWDEPSAELSQAENINRLVHHHVGRWIALSPETPDAQIIDRARRELDVQIDARTVRRIRGAA